MSESIELIRKQIRDKQINHIKNLYPGRELDALIAKFVMELQIETWQSETGEATDYWYRTNNSSRNDDDLERVPNYSTVLYSAEKILTKFDKWTIQSESRIDSIAASFDTKEKAIPQIRGCKSIPEAICKAALVAIVEKNKIIEQLLEE